MKMNYFVVGTNNMDASVAFYDSLFEGRGVSKIATLDRMTFWRGDDFTFAAAIPFDEDVATNGNGTMFGFGVESQEEVNAIYSKAISLGGRCEGEPSQKGPRFSAYVRDPDQNKICFYV